MSMNLSPKQLATLNEAASDRRRFASKITRVLTIDGVDYSSHIDRDAGGLKYSGEDPAEGEPAALLEGWLDVPLAAEGRESAELTKCHLDYYIGGVRYEGFRGEIVWLEVEHGKTAFHAATAGYHAAKEILETDRTYTNARPSDALYEGVAVLPYDGIEISPIDDPPFTVDPEDAFHWTDYVADLTEAVREECRLALADTPLNVATGQPVGTLPLDTAVAWQFTEGVDFDYGELSVKPRREERYARVVVYKELSNGSHLKLAEAGVDNKGKRVRGTLVLEQSEEDTEVAAQRAYREAVAVADNDLILEWPCEYPLFSVWTGDVVAITGREISGETVIVREYEARLVAPAVDPEAKRSSFKAIGTKRSERVEPLARTTYARTSPVVKVS